MACSTIRYGPGVTKEIGQDMVNMNAKNVCVMTDPLIAKLSPMKAVLDSLSKNKINFKIYDSVRVEPTDKRYIKISVVLNAKELII